MSNNHGNNGCRNLFTLEDVEIGVRYWLLYIVSSSLFLVVLGFGTVIYGANNNWKNSDEVGNVFIYPLEVPHYAPITLLYGFGIYFVFTGILGMSLLVFRQNYSYMVFLLRTYILGPVIPVLLCVIFIVVQAIMWPHTRESLTDLLRSYVNAAMYSVYDWHRERMDEIQTHYHCCGVSNYSDWPETPPSCCINGEEFDSSIPQADSCTVPYMQRMGASGNIYMTGCVDKLMQRYLVHYGIVCTFILVYIFIVTIGVVYAFYLIHYYKRLPACEITEAIELQNIRLNMHHTRTHRNPTDNNDYIAQTSRQANTIVRPNRISVCTHSDHSHHQSTSPLLDMESINQNNFAQLQNYENVLNEERQLVSSQQTVI